MSSGSKKLSQVAPLGSEMGMIFFNAKVNSGILQPKVIRPASVRMRSKALFPGSTTAFFFWMSQI